MVIEAKSEGEVEWVLVYNWFIMAHYLWLQKYIVSVNSETSHVYLHTYMASISLSLKTFQIDLHFLWL